MSCLSVRRRSLRSGAGAWRSFAPLTAVLMGLAAPTAALAADTQAPKLVSASASPAWVNVTSGPAAVTVTFRVTDDDSGAALPVVSGDSDLSKETTPTGTVTRVSGTPQDGVYKAKLTVAKGAVGGGWTASALKLEDAAGNATPGAVTLARFTVFSFGFDTFAPKLVSSSIEPASVDVTSAPATVLVTLHITDDYTGTRVPTVDVTLPDGSETRSVGDGRFLSGDVLDGMWAVPIIVPMNVASGAWTLTLRPLRDAAGNSGKPIALGKVTVKSAAPVTPQTPATPATPKPAAGTGPAPAAGAAAPTVDAGQGGVLGARATSTSRLSFAGTSKRLTISRKGTLAIALKCTGINRCKGSLRLYSKVRGKKVKIVSKRVSVAAGKTVKVRFTLTRKGRTVLTRGRSLKATASVWTDGIKAPKTRALSTKRLK